MAEYIADPESCRIATGDLSRELDMEKPDTPLYEFQNELPFYPVPDLN